MKAPVWMIAIMLLLAMYPKGLAMNLTVGIDLGTSFTVVSYHPDMLATTTGKSKAREDKGVSLHSPRFINESASGSPLFPSMVTFSALPSTITTTTTTKTSSTTTTTTNTTAKTSTTTTTTTNSTTAPTRVAIGTTSSTLAMTLPERTVHHAKCLQGRYFDDPSIQSRIADLPYKVKGCGRFTVSSATGGDSPVTVTDFKAGVCLSTTTTGQDKKVVPIEVVSALVLKYVKLAAEKELAPHRVTRAVITIPAHFSHKQRRATMLAAQLAGLEVVHLLPETTAAALAYFSSSCYHNLQHHDEESPFRVMVVDFGGGTFDVSAMEYHKGGLTVRAVDGDPGLGGGDIDAALAHRLLKSFEKQSGVVVDLSTTEGRTVMVKLRQVAERVKKELSTKPSSRVIVDCLYRGYGFNYKVKRWWFEDQVARPFLQRTLIHINNCIRAAKWKKGWGIDMVLLVGGSTRMPLFQHMVGRVLGVEPTTVLHPDLAVAEGAALLAYQMTAMGQQKARRVKTIKDVTPLSVGVEVCGGGGGCLEHLDQFDTEVIPRFSPLPNQGFKSMKTHLMEKDDMDFAVVEGRYLLDSGNKVVGRFILKGLKTAKAKRKERVAVTIIVDNNGIIHAKLNSMHNKGDHGLTITNVTGLANPDPKMVEMFQKAMAEFFPL